jgi:hypothetical protein
VSSELCQQFESLLLIPPGADPGVIETSAACAILHSFYTEIEKKPKDYRSRLG